MIHELIYNHKNLRDFGVFCSGADSFGTPERDITVVEVPGRSGTLTIDNHRFKNLTVTYQCYMRDNFIKKFRETIAFLQSEAGYHRIETDWEPECFRVGRFTGPLNPETAGFNHQHGKFKLQFDCKPQRFLKSGEQELTFTKSESIFNPTEFDALPLLYIEGNGTLLINDKLITVKDNSAGVYIDTEIREAYNGKTNLNSIVSISEGLAIPPGVCPIGIDGLTKVVITPRWWTV